MSKSLTILKASPRGFCGGVERAILIVEKAIEKYGAPIYVRHEIVHNRYVVENLKKKGAVFVEDLQEVPDDRPVIFSAHGVAKAVPEEAERRNLLYLDATCPLVSKVHKESEKLYKKGYFIFLIGHKNHPEVIGTLGQLPEEAICLVETIEDVQAITLPENTQVGYITQTTLSVDDTKEIIQALQKKFPLIKGPKKDDICYATTNRQLAIKSIAKKADLILVIGSPNSSNSQRLVETAKKAGCKHAYLIDTAQEIQWDLLHDIRTLGLAAGASAPEELVQEVIEACQQRFSVDITEEIVAEENIEYKLPKFL